MAFFNLNLAMTLGFLLAACLFAGLLADRFRFPKVTVYLLVGIIFGPSLFDWIPHEHLHELHGIADLAMTLVLFNLGCHFPLSLIRRVFKRSLWLSLGELTTTFFSVIVALLLFGQSGESAVLLGALALATAPATTILVLQESTSQGPVTTYIGTLVALNNFAAIVAFEVVFIVIQLLQRQMSSPLLSQLGWLVGEVLGALTIGAVAGVSVSYGCGLLKQNKWLVMLIATTVTVLGCCEMLGFPYMLAFLAMGMTLVNTSDHGDQIVEELDHLTGLLCVIFFAVHGAELDLQAFRVAGFVGGVYILGRIVGKCVGVSLVARIIKEPPHVVHWLGPSLLAQAGAAIALSAIAVDRIPEIGRPVQTVILGSVVFFELVGPFLIRFSVLRAGEVPLAQAIHHSPNDPLGQFGRIWNRVLIALGREPNDTLLPRELTVEQLMRRNVTGIAAYASFDEIIHFIEHSHDNTYPVIDANRSVVGLISFSRLSSALFDPMVGPLVRAEDLAIPIDTLLFADDTVPRVLDLLQSRSDDCFPVVARKHPHELVGIVRRSDITNMLIRGRRKR